MSRIDLLPPSEFREIHLLPGDFYFGGGAVRLVTLLGSCVAVILWHPYLRIGGMCHYMLPARGHGRMAEPDGRYAEEAMELFRREVMRTGAPFSEYRAHLFGGGNMFSSRPAPAIQNVSSRNVEAARRLTTHLGLTAEVEHLGGIGYRKLSFDFCSGETSLFHRPNLIDFSPAEKRSKTA